MNKLKYILLGLVLGSTIVFGRTIVDTILKLGNGTDVDIVIEAELGKGVANPALNYDSTNDKWQFCNEGGPCEDMGSGGGGGGIPLLGKGSLLTGDGVTNGEFTACADDELIVWDAAEVAGFKCEAKPVAAAPLYHVTTRVGSYVVGSGVNPSFLDLAMTDLNTTFTAVSDKPLLITFINQFITEGSIASTTNRIGCAIQIGRTGGQPLTGGIELPKFAIRDAATAGTIGGTGSMPSVLDQNPISAGDVINYFFTLKADKGECEWSSANPTIIIQQGL